MTELARRRTTDPQQERQLDMALQSARQLLGLIETLFELSDAGAGRLKLEAAPFPVAPSLDAVIAEMAGPAGGAGMTISAEVDPSLPATLVGDAGRIKQLLRIFIGNAIKFAQRGRITVRARMIGDGSPEVLLRLEVADEGEPIAPALAERLFEPFAQADESLTRSHGGVGTGLALTAQIARLMGGRAGVTGEEGKGNTFWAEFRLPVADGH